MIIVNNKGELWYNKICYKCAYGKNGFIKSKKEGDGCTPIGTFHINKLFLREDRIKTIRSAGYSLDCHLIILKATGMDFEGILQAWRAIVSILHIRIRRRTQIL